MGPRSADRGNAGTGDVDLDKYKLQWGRDQLIAEITRLSYAPTPSKRLQWGRDQLIAEIRQKATALSRSVSLQWGRDQLIAEIPMRFWPSVSATWLQWGRDQLIAEMLREAMEAAGKFHASMGPRSDSRANDRGA